MKNFEYVKSEAGKTPATESEIRLFLQRHGLEPDAEANEEECDRIMEEAAKLAIEAHMSKSGYSANN